MSTSTTTLAEHTTLRLGGPPRAFTVASDTDDLINTVTKLDAQQEPLLLLGGGSNLVVADSGFEGTVVKIATTGTEFGPGGRVSAAAGEEWDTFVEHTIARGLGGLECLSGIPGLVGATPIQNVGAYGWEVAEFVTGVDLLDRRGGRRAVLTAGDLGFGYRTSVLKGTDTGVVLGVTFTLHTDGLSQPVRYAELARTLGVEVGSRLPAADVREAVLALRRGKGMVLDPADHDTWSAGSFFTNPIISEADLAAVLETIASVVGEDVPVPQYPADTGVKLSAAWLIERAGYGKGYQGPGGRVSLSHKHTLALTNRGSAATADLLGLAREIRDGVAARFGVELRPEPLLIGCSL